jgi:uncharacterized protein
LILNTPLCKSVGAMVAAFFVTCNAWALEPREIYAAMEAGACTPNSELLHEQAVNGVVEAELEFGRAINQNLCGVVESWSPGMPEEWFRKAAEQGNAEAQAELGNELVGNRTVEGEDEGVYWYLKAIEQGNAAAQFSLAQIYHRGGRSIHNLKDINKALQYYNQAAAQGDVSAYMMLGGIYEEGKEVPEDNAVAVQWYRKAAEAGDSYGQLNLADMITEGRGVSRDDKEAFAWYSKSAAQGNEFSQYRMGRMLEHGVGTTRNEHKAAQLYQQAAEAQFGKAQLALGKMYATGRGGLPKSKAKAKYWMIKAIDRGAPQAEEELQKL